MKRISFAAVAAAACLSLMFGSACSKTGSQGATERPPASSASIPTVKTSTSVPAVDAELATVNSELRGVDGDLSTANSELSTSQEGDVRS
jgi:hypothetical protein